MQEKHDWNIKSTTSEEIWALLSFSPRGENLHLPINSSFMASLVNRYFLNIPICFDQRNKTNFSRLSNTDKEAELRNEFILCFLRNSMSMFHS